MVDTVVDFISLIKDVRGNQFDIDGLPLNGKWKDIKDWHTAVNVTADQVVIDAAEVSSDKDAAEAALVSALGVITTVSASAADASGFANASEASAVTAAASEIKTGEDVVASTAIVAGISVDLAAIAAAKLDAEVSATTSGNFSAAAQVSANTAATSQQGSSVNAANALQSASNADVSEGNALAYRDATKTLSDATEVNATAAAASASTAESSRVAGVASSDSANKWSSELEDVSVNDGVNPAGFSAFHWAQKAINIVGGVTGFTDLSDVPANFTGAAGHTLRINGAGNAIEFVLGTAVEVGLGNVNNTSDANKPLSVAATTALGLKAAATVTDSLGIRATALETNTVGITSQAASGNDPDRVQISKVVYSTASQTLGATEPEALTRYDLTAAMLAAETIGAY
jgi:hypothetical protein